MALILNRFKAMSGVALKHLVDIVAMFNV